MALLADGPLGLYGLRRRRSRGRRQRLPSRRLPRRAGRLRCAPARREFETRRRARRTDRRGLDARSEEHTSELQSLMRISYAVFCLKKKKSEQQKNTAGLSTKVTHTKYSS